MQRSIAPPIRRRWPAVLLAVLVVIVLTFQVLSTFYVDVLWFREVGYSGVFWGIIRAKTFLAFSFGLVFFALLYANLLIVRALTPKYRALTPEQEVIERYRLALEPYLRWLLPLFALVIGLFVGFGVSTEWRTYMLWRNSGGVSFGMSDPLFHRDASYYVFALPWLEFIQGWLFSSLVGITFIIGVGHYLSGGIRPQAPRLGEKVTPAVKAHLSVLLGLIVLVKAWGYYLGQFDLLASPRGVVQGASYTDVNAQLPALRLLVLIAVVCAALFLVNIWRKGWALPVAGVVLLALASVVVGGIYPAAIQRLRVAPQELQKERPYIKYNIEFTRKAFGLDKIQVSSRDVTAAVTPTEVAENELTISNIRLWTPTVLLDNFKSFQRIKPYYEFDDVDVDRYLLDGEPRVVMLSTREVTQNGIPGGGGTWLNQHLVYTHGFGAVASQVNTSTTEGAPLFTLKDIPPQGQPLPEQPRVYYGEREDVPFVIVNTNQRELDYEDATGRQTWVYDGKGGIPMGGLFQKAIFAWKYKDVNLLISGLIKGDSRILINRDIQTRINKAAPFLRYDSDPYSAVVDGHLVWIQDAYTTSDRFPYSQSVNLSDATDGALSGSVNYMRNSVKVVVDAYDGTMRFYVTDESDPIIQVWRNAFPDLFVSMDQVSPDLRAHFRYPENLFQAQSQQFANYHVTDPGAFYQKQDFWEIPSDPTGQANAGEGSAVAPHPVRPYYVLMKLPGETSEEFVLVMPFTPSERQNLVGWMAASSDPAKYGQLVTYTFPQGRNIDGPSLVFSRINQNQTFSSERTLLSQAGSTLKFGDLLVIPVGQSLLYVQPVYVQSEETAIPELKRVLVVNGGTVGIGDTLPEALNAALGGQVVPPPDGGGQPPPTGTVDQRIAQLVAQALEHFDAAEEALKQGDLATYQREIEAAKALIEQANILAEKKGLATVPLPTPSASATPTPTASPTP